MLGRTLRRKATIALMVAGIFALAICNLDGETCHQEISDRQAVVAGFLQFADQSKAQMGSRGNLESMGVTTFVEATGVNGSGVILAVVDTGVDPAGGGFRNTSGVSRIISWKDLTGEGWAKVSGKYKERNGYIDVENERFNVATLKSKTGVYYFGTLPAILSKATGKSNIAFVVFDPHTSGRYEAVCIDTDGDRSFADEAVLYSYDQTKTVASLQNRIGSTISVVVSDISRTGESVNFGFDIEGHGTALASIAAGNGPGEYCGVAPGCSIIAIKAVGSNGHGNWADIVDGIRLALNKGAQVILVGAVPETADEDTAWESVEKEAASQGAVVVTPAGNNGPGVGTLSTRANSSAVVVAGGYLPKNSLANLLGVEAQSDIWYPYSSCGPDASGNSGISILCPAITAAPVQAEGGNTRFALVEGTSVSSAYAAGSLVLLRSALGQKKGVSNTEVSIRMLRSLTEGAVPLDDVTPVEQGSGRVNVWNAWNLLKANIQNPRLFIARKWNGITEGKGLVLQGDTFGAMPLWVDNNAPWERDVTLSSNVSWLRIEKATMKLPPVSQSSTWIRGDPEISPGFYSGEIQVNDSDTPGVDGRLCISQIIPREFEDASLVSENPSMTLDMSIRPGRLLRREFVLVPENVRSVRMGFDTSSFSSCFAVYNPDGVLVASGRIRGNDPVEIGYPKAGIWQICVYPDLQDVANSTSANRVQIALTGLLVVDAGIHGESQKLVVYSDAPQAGILRFASRDASSEWYYKESGLISTASASVVTLPEIQDSVESLIMRIGTVNSATLRVYLYWFNADAAKWEEVASKTTDSTGSAELYYTNVHPGKYLAYIEGSAETSLVYREIEAFLVGDAAAVAPSTDGEMSKLLKQGRNELNIIPGVTPSAPRLVIFETESGIPVVFVRDVLSKESVPSVQILGNGSVRTIRAWASNSTYPLDVVVTVGGVSYQLDHGKVTSRIPPANTITYQSASGFTIVYDVGQSGGQ